MKNLLLIISFILFTQLCFSQHSFYAGASYETGVPSGNKFASSGSILSTHVMSGHNAGNIGLQWRFKDQFTVEVGLGQAYDTWRLKDKQFENRHDGFIVKLHNNHYSWNYFASLAYSYPIVEDDIYLYGQLAYSFNQLSANTLNQHEEFEQVKNDVYENVNMITTYSSKNRSIVPEIGIQKKIGDKHLLSAGIKMNIGNTVIKSGIYTVDSLYSNGSITKDTYESKGSFIALSVKYSYLLYQLGKRDPEDKPEKEKKEKPKKEKKEKPKKEKKEKPKKEKKEKPKKEKKEKPKKEKKKRKKRKKKYKKGNSSHSIRTRYQPDDIFDDDYIPPSP